MIRTPIQLPVERTPEVLFDPRSPSVGITRTPIQVEKKQETDNVAEVSTSNVEELLDPRSPTSGIDRTPIYTKPEKTQGIKIGLVLHHNTFSKS